MATFYLSNVDNSQHGEMFGSDAFFDLRPEGRQGGQLKDLARGDTCVVASREGGDVVFDWFAFQREELHNHPRLGGETRVFYGTHKRREVLPKGVAADSEDYSPFFIKNGAFKRGSVFRATPSTWTPEEIHASVESYLTMMKQHRSGEPFVKTAEYQELANRFGRSPKAFERRAQNISYVLSLLGRDWLPGLLPAKHVGVNVVDQIERHLAALEGNQATGEAVFEERVRQIASKPLGGSPPLGTVAPKKTSGTTTQYVRDPQIAGWVLRNAEGVCCRATGLF